MDDRIGQWCRREGTKWHLIESRIADRYVTHCGREMALYADGHDLRFAERLVWEAEACQRCEGITR